MPNPVLEVFTLGPFGTNCMLVYPPTSLPGAPEASGVGRAAMTGEGRPGRPCWIADASFAPGPIVERVRELGLVPQAIVLTHAHADHIAGLEQLRDAFRDGGASTVPVVLHELEKEFLTDPVLNLSAGFGLPMRCRPAEKLLKGGETLELAGEPWRVLHTPGHSPGGITLVHDASETAIVGDTLFNDSVGRSDFPTSSPEALERSIRERLYTLPGGTVVYPGHGPTTTIAREMRENPFMRG